MSLDNAFYQQMMDLSFSNEDFDEFHWEKSIQHQKIVS